MPIAYVPKINQRSIGSELLIVNESHVVGITAVNTASPNQIRLIEVPLQESPSSVAIPGYTEVLSAPGTNEFRVDYTSGRITFNASASGNTVFATYKGRGSIVDAEDVNELQGPVGVALDYDGEITAGHVKPISISTNVAHDFTFPADVIITGDLTVNGTTTSINTETITIEDNIVLLNSNVTGSPTLDAGLEVERGTSPNVTFLWDETNDSWQLNNTSGSPILEAFDSGTVSIPGILSITGPIRIADGSMSAPAYSFSGDTDTGIFRSGANTVAIATGGSQAATFASNVLTLSQANSGFQANGGGGSVGYVDFYGSASGQYRVGLSGSNVVTTAAANGTLSVGAMTLTISPAAAPITTFNSAGILLGSGRFRTPQIGIGTEPLATFHNAGSTLLGLTTATNPVSIAASVVDSFSGIRITTTSATTVSLPTPTDTTMGRFFTVLHDDDSTSTLNINGSNIGVGKGSTFMWDGDSWIPVGATGGFQVMAGDPGSPVQGDVWFDTVTSQFKGYNGASTVILG